MTDWTVEGDGGLDEQFEEHRRPLTGVAYRILGSWSDAEDVVQDTWLKWSRHAGSVTSPRAWLTRVVVRASIDRLRERQNRREEYVGPWLPEPVSSEPRPDDTAELRDSVGMGMLVVLESLSPLERAVFVLRQAFGWGYDDIARMLDRSQAAVRQLDHRARQHVDEGRPRYEVPEPVARETTRRFIDACLGGNVEQLLAVLSPDVVLVSDAAGQVRAPRRPIVGADKVARFLAAVASAGLEDVTVETAPVNGQVALVARAGGRAVTTLSLDVDEAGLIRALYLVAAPTKLAHV